MRSACHAKILLMECAYLRCLFALSGMGFVGGEGDVRVSATAAWLRLDAHYGAVVRRRTLTLPLLV